MQYPLTRPITPGVLRDIQDGKRYQQFSGPGKFFSTAEHAGLMLCADGVPLFKSSGKDDQNQKFPSFFTYKN